MRDKLAHQIGVPILALLVLGGMAAEKRLLHAPAGDSDAYHDRVLAVSENIPMNVDGYVGHNETILPAAVALLRPNVIFNRRYDNREARLSATLLLVQCRDARDILGHYPPVCYPAHGWVQENAVPRDWSIDGMEIHGMEYTFAANSPTKSGRITILDFMLLPAGGTVRDMKGVITAAGDSRRKLFGAGQVQVVMDADMGPEDREAVFKTLITAAGPTLKAIMAGESK
ncbi:MAG: exosortase-associated EpsI family protein [Planctomycetota bacterium]|nr:exosortase-associated EpsI family protein [Planctomycetota bacterium]